MIVKINGTEHDLYPSFSKETGNPRIVDRHGRILHEGTYVTLARVEADDGVYVVASEYWDTIPINALVRMQIVETKIRA